MVGQPRFVAGQSQRWGAGEWVLGRRDERDADVLALVAV